MLSGIEALAYTKKTKSKGFSTGKLTKVRLDGPIRLKEMVIKMLYAYDIS